MSADQETIVPTSDIDTLRPDALKGSFTSFADAVLAQLRATQVVPERRYALSPGQPGQVAAQFDAPADTSLLDSISYHAQPDAELVRGFVGAWGAVGEVLSFYQGKLARIGYLRTAPDHPSLRHLARGIDLRVPPALSAEAVVAFQVQPPPSGPPQLTIAQGQPLMGMAADASAALQFQTLADVLAEPGWNQVSLMPASPAALPQTAIADAAARRQSISTATVQLFLGTLASGLAAGDALAVLNRGDDAGSGVYLGAVASVTVDAAVGVSLVTLLAPLAWQGAGEPLTLRDPIVLRFLHDLPLWGSDAAAWDALTPADRAALAPIRQGVARWNAESRTWERTATGLPASDILALTEEPASGTLWASMPSGLYRLPRGASAFQPSAPGTGRMAYSVLLAQTGVLYAGGASGSVVQSLDAGRTWRRLGAAPPPAGQPQSADPRLPDCPVLSLTYAQGVLLAGTDAGVFLWQESVPGWREWNAGLPGYTREGRRAQASIYALVFDLSTATLYAATDTGVFRGTLHTAGWQPFSTGLPASPIAAPAIVAASAKPTPGAAGSGQQALNSAAPARQQAAAPVQSLALIRDSTGSPCLLASTMQGLYRRRPGETGWSALPPLPGQAPVALTPGLLQDSGTVYAATAQGTWQSTDLGTTWQPLGSAGEGATTLLAASSGLWKAGVYIGSIARDWPGISLADDRLETTATLPLLRPGSLALLAEPGGRALAFDVANVSVEPRAQFGRRRQVTVVALAPASSLPGFSRRTARLSVQPVALELKSIALPQPCSVGGPGLALAAGDRTLTPGRSVVVAGSPPSAVITAPLGGVLLAAPGQPPAFRLPRTDVTGLLRWNGLLYAVTDHVLYPVHGGASIPGVDPAWLFASSGKSLLAATGRQLLQLAADGSWATMLALPVRPTALLADEIQGITWVAGQGAEAGVFTLRPGATTSLRIAQPPPAPVNALLWQGSTLLSATAAGVYRLAAGKWTLLCCAELVVYTLAGDPATGPAVLLLGTSAGVLRLSPGKRPVPAGSARGHVRRLAVDPSGAVCATFDQSGQTVVALLPAGGKDWQPLSLGLIGQVSALQFEASPAAGTPSTPVIATRAQPQGAVWTPHSAVLARLPSELAPSLDLALPTRAVTTALKQAGIVWTSSTRIETIVADSRWCISDPKAGAFFLETDATGATIEVMTATALQVCACPPAPPGSSPGAERIWTLKLPSASETLTLRALPGQVTPIPAPADAPLLAARYTAGAPPDGTTANPYGIMLDRPLDTPLDPASVTVFGNVGIARHAFAVSDEVLGSGSSVKSFQRFTLAHPTPLTQSAAGAQSGLLGESLTIRITGGGPDRPALGIRTQAIKEADSVVWQQVRTFQYSRPDDRHFAAGVDRQGRTFILFGDGISGSRLPTGVNNVRADYLTGAGLIGNLPAGNLRTAMRMPAVVVRCSNPLPGTGGRDAPPVDAVRERIGRNSDTLNRLVVAADAERLALASGDGIAKAHARLIPLAHRRTLILTVGTEDGSPATPLLPALRAGLLAAGAPASLQVLDAQRISLKLEAEIRCTPAAGPADTLAGVAQLLEKRFGYGASSFDRTLRAAQLVAAIQQAEGVASCALRAFHRSDRARTLEQEIAAPHAGFSSPTTPAASLLFLEPTPILTLGGAV